MTDNESTFSAPIRAAQNPDYPPISLEISSYLYKIQQKVLENPNYFQDLACPYPPAVRGRLENIFLTSTVDAEEIAASVDEYFGVDSDSRAYEILVRDAKKAYLTLTRLMQKLETSSKTEESILRIKALAQLQERLLAIMEKAEGHKQIHVFKRTLMDIIERVLTPDQRTSVMSQIDDALKA